MTALLFAQALVGAVTRELCIALLALADLIDPPAVSPRERAERAVTATLEPVPDTVPDAWVVTW